jgi:ABC-type antimicrobial peptide transport system permease subunit
VIHLLLARLRANRLRAAVLVLGIAAATTAFIVLTGEVAEQHLELRGRVSDQSAPNFDILVRPAGSRTDLETKQGLVRANFLSGQFGGITLRQWRQIQELSGVQVAAPVAMVGYVLQSVTIPIDITNRLSPADQQLFTASVRRRSARGLSEFARPAINYSYVTTARISEVGTLNDPGELGYGVTPPGGRPRVICPVRPKATGGPFEVRSQRNGTCWSRVNGPNGTGFTLLPRGHVGILVQWTFPFLLAAIDPAQEAELAGLDRAVTRGSYLLQRGIAPGHGRHSVPVLMAEHARFDDQDEISIQRLSAAAAAEFGSGLSTDRLDALLDTERGPVVATASITADAAYQRLLTASLQLPAGPVVDSYWTSGRVSYRLEPDGSLRPRPVDNPASIWTAPLDLRGYVEVAPDAADTAFRPLSKHALLAKSVAPDGAGPRLAAIGVFDESRLEQGSGQAWLGGYRTEPLQPADPASSALLGGRTLLPDSNIAGYLLSSPTMLTSLDAASVFTDSSVFDNVSDAAPISAVRVRVTGAHGVDAVSRERVRLVAEAVAETTGLDVDVTVGSSPTTRRIVLPAGSAGRPELRLSEQWQRKGVVVAVLLAVDRKSLLLFALVLVVCGVFTANAAGAAARSPRLELSTLSCLGWTRGQLMSLLLGEMAVIGAAAGITGALVSLLTAEALGVPASIGRALAAVPAALAVTLLAAAWPAWRASRASPLPELSAAAAWSSPAKGGGLKKVRGPSRLAYRNLRAEPVRTALGMAAVGVGSAGLTLLLAITVAFRGSVVGSLLGDAISLQARRVDYLAVLITLLLAAIAVADVSYLNMRDRRDDLALLRAVGWTAGRLGQLIVSEGVLIGLAGSAAGAGLGLATTAALAGSAPGSLWLLAGLTALTGTLISAVASLLAALSLPLLVRAPSLSRD